MATSSSPYDMLFPGVGERSIQPPSGVPTPPPGAGDTNGDGDGDGESLGPAVPGVNRLECGPGDGLGDGPASDVRRRAGDGPATGRRRDLDHPLSNTAPR